MDWKLLLTVFGTTFLAELGDKTQLATLSFASANKHPLTIFLGGSLALICTTLLAVVVGAGLQRVVPARVMHGVASAAFIVIGVILLVKTLRAG
jgi:putative Ca2+/H+ antiporter (TMEM165/GDT1 family)